jgi:VacB/RNase II family 3'-5' exoribonuclease
MDIQKTGGHQWIPRDIETPGREVSHDTTAEVSSSTDQLTLRDQSRGTETTRGAQINIREAPSFQKTQGKQGKERWRDRGMRIHTAATAVGGNIANLSANMALQKSGQGGRPIADLKIIADHALESYDLLTDFDDKAMREVKNLSGVAPKIDASVRDMRNMLWCSIDNDDSKDLDQLSVAEKLPNGDVKIYVAVADVDCMVPKGSAIDAHAQQNTTSVYTPEKIFPMLPPELSTDLTSLNPDKDRLAMVIEYVVGSDGLIKESDVYRAQVNNHAKLAYNAVSAWLDGKEPIPEAAAKVSGMEEQLRMQDEVAQKLKERRHENGSLTIETIKPEIKVLDTGELNIQPEKQNRAQELIEDFMVAANGVTARFLAKHDFPTIMRVVKTPQRWDRIVALASQEGTKLPKKPDSAALEKFMTEQKAKDPDHFPDLSLTIVKLMGRGEYVVQDPGSSAIGHFGLAVKDYAHSTAPNRRYPDLITQRLLKAAIEGLPCPYTKNQLEQLALQCTEQEKNADKAERQVNKSAMALELSDKIGQTFEAFVTGASDKGTWIRLTDPPAEGRLVEGQRGLDVGDKIKVTLTSLNIEKGFIDFSRGGKH